MVGAAREDGRMRRVLQLPKMISIRWRVPGYVALAIAVVGCGMLAWTQHSQRTSAIAQARAFAESVHQLTLAGLTALMITGNAGRRDTFLDQIGQSNDVRSLRVVRGPEVTRQFGAGTVSEQPLEGVERQVLESGRAIFEVHDGEDGPYLKAVMPALGKRNYLGKDCLGCHDVPEGTVLGAVSLEISLERTEEALNASLRDAIVGALACLALLAALAWFAISRSVVLPLDRLADKLRLLAQGRIEHGPRLVARGRDEIAEVVKAFDQVLAKAQESLRAERVAGDVFEHALEGIVVTDPRGTIVRVNPAFTKTTGYSAEEAIGRNPRMLQSGQHGEDFYRTFWDALTKRGEWQGDIWNRRKNGEVYPEWLNISRVCDERGEVQNYVAVFSDITERKRAELRMQHEAHHDGLTGLPNRVLFRDRLEQALALARRRAGRMAVMFLDLDKFKLVNDTLGHEIGDALLCEMARRLRGAVRESDTVARLGGDEFTIVLPEIATSEDAVKIAAKVLEAVNRPYNLHGQTLFATASVGVSIFPDHGEDAETLLKHADTAMYHVKGSGRDGAAVFDADCAAGDAARANAFG
jgi:diguanylate cyclase (GGDEF)-like protein/PAS domain S-box-containing protein